MAPTDGKEAVALKSREKIQARVILAVAKGAGEH
jgi:hypothetical protein